MFVRKTRDETESNVSSDNQIVLNRPHPKEWWNENQGRKTLLKNVFMEVSDDSEGDDGQPFYNKKKDKVYQASKKEYEKNLSFIEK